MTSVSSSAAHKARQLLSGPNGEVIAITAIAALILVIVGALKVFAPADPLISTDLATLERAFDKNEVGAMNRYGGKRLEISANVSSVALDSNDRVAVYLESIGLLPVRAGINDASRKKAGTLNGGDAIVIRCPQLAESLSKPVLDECTIL